MLRAERFERHLLIKNQALLKTAASALGCLLEV